MNKLDPIQYCKGEMWLDVAIPLISRLSPIN